MAPPSDDHECGWRGYAQQLQSDLDQIKAEVAELKRQKFGRRSEKAPKMPPMDREVRGGTKVDPAEALRKRRERALAKEKLVAVSVQVPVPAPERCCPHCQRMDLRPVGEGKASTTYDYVPGFFRRRIVRRETLACPCGEYIVTAPCPEKSTDKTRYAPSFIAHLIVSKCEDCLPLYRLEKQYNRIGVPLALRGNRKPGSGDRGVSRSRRCATRGDRSPVTWAIRTRRIPGSCRTPLVLRLHDAR